MPSAPWATAGAAPDPSSFMPEQDPNVYKNTPATHGISGEGLNAWADPGAESLAQLNSLLAGDRAEAQRVLKGMGWRGSVEEFQALTAAQRAAFVRDNGVNGKATFHGNGDPMLAGFAKNADGSYDFTRWHDGSPSGYDANLNPIPGQNPTHPWLKAVEKLAPGINPAAGAPVDWTGGQRPQGAQPGGTQPTEMAPPVTMPVARPVTGPGTTPPPSPRIAAPTITPPTMPTIRQPQMATAPYFRPPTMPTRVDETGAGPVIRPPTGRSL